MDAVLSAVVGLAGVGLLLALIHAARTGERRHVGVAVPVAVAAALATAAGGRWPATAWLLAVALLAAPAPLARLARRPAAWPVLALFALGGVVAGYGALARVLCAGGSDPCESVVPDVALAAGGALAASAFVWLYVAGALVR